MSDLYWLLRAITKLPEAQLVAKVEWADGVQIMRDEASTAFHKDLELKNQIRQLKDEIARPPPIPKKVVKRRSKSAPRKRKRDGGVKSTLSRIRKTKPKARLHSATRTPLKHKLRKAGPQGDTGPVQARPFSPTPARKKKKGTAQGPEVLSIEAPPDPDADTKPKKASGRFSKQKVGYVYRPYL